MKADPVDTTSSRSPPAVTNFRHTTGTIPDNISKFQVAFVSNICSSVPEDRYSTSTDNDEENCDAEITTITRWQMPSQATTMVMSPTRPVSTPLKVDYSTQGDPNQTAPKGNHGYNQNDSTMPIQHTNNYLIPDGSDRFRT